MSSFFSAGRSFGRDLMRGFPHLAHELAHFVDRDRRGALVAHAQEGAAARVAGKGFLDVEVFFLAQLGPTLADIGSELPLRTASIFFLNVSALNGLTM